MTTDEREAVERVANRLIDQRDELWYGGTDADRLHYWRDKAIRGGRTLLRLVERGASPDGDRAAAANAVEPVSRLQQSQHPLREKVADEIADIHDHRARDEQLEAADRILAIPEIADVLTRATLQDAEHPQPPGAQTNR